MTRPATRGPSSSVTTFLEPVRRRLEVAGALLGVVIVGGVYIAFGPSQNVLDRLGYAVIPNQWDQPFWQHVTVLGDPVVAVVGTLLAVVWVWGRDRRRAATCVVVPLVAIMLCELVLKPLVGRQLGGIYSYPSGHVTTAAAMLADLVLVTPGWWRWLTGFVATAGAGLVAVAVIASRQHYPSDAVAALLLVPAVTIVVDSLNRPGLGAAVRSFRRHATVA
jgi:membrane-associated phospholipid phosphatase